MVDTAGLEANKRNVIALAALFVVMAAACSGGDGASEGAATYEPRGDGGNAALLTGTLAYEGGCFYVDTAEGDRFLPVFPVGSVDTSGRTLTYQGTDYTAGEELALGGGESPRTADMAEAASIPRGCAAEVGLWVVNQEG